MARFPLTTNTAAGAAKKVSATSMPTLRFRAQVYPLNSVGTVYLGTDSDTSAANYQFALIGGGTVWMEEGEPPMYRADPSLWYYTVSIDGMGLTGGTYEP